AYSEATGIGPHEGAAVSVEIDGTVRVVVGATSQGQGHETTLAQICAERLGVPLASITVSGGATPRFPASAGTVPSPLPVIVGNAVAQASDAVSDKIRRVAARALECAADDVVLVDGRAHVKGAPDRGHDLRAIALLAQRPDVVRDLGEPGLAATRYVSPAS